MGSVNMKDTDYYKSGDHKKNCLAAREKAVIRSKELKIQRINEYYKNPILCANCKTPIKYEKHKESKFCGSSCSAKFNNT